MAVDSIFGGSSDSVPLSDAALALLNQFLTDTVGSSITNSTIDGSRVVVGTGADGEIQGGVTPGLGIISGTIVNGELSLDISLPGATGMVFEGIDDATPEAWGDYLKTVVDAYSAGAEQTTSLYAAIDHLVAQIREQGVTSMVVRVFDLLAGGQAGASFPLADGSTDIVIDAGRNLGVEIFAVNLSQLAASQTVVFKGIEAAIVGSEGAVRAEGSTAIQIVGDTAAQHITGGDGNDTLVGGGGNDTLAGGLGDDIFGFSALGHHVVTDFSTTHDHLAFDVSGISTVAQLAAMVTSVEQTSQGVTYNFGGSASITLIGVSAAQLTADLINLSI